MFDYRYALIRYVPDAIRMEPINIGIILQSIDRIDFRLNTQASKKGIIDTTTFKRWRGFLDEEILGDAIPLFQPEKTSLQFFSHLQELCDKTVILSRPLTVAREIDNFDQLLESLYQRLVAPPEPETPESANRPTGVFRQFAEDHKFLHRGMKRHAHVTIGNDRLWMAYRQMHNGAVFAMDKVEVAHRIGETSYEIERLPYIAHHLPRFVEAKIDDKPTEYCLLVDELKEPFTDQSKDEFDAMQEDLERAIEKIKTAGGRILRDRDAAKKLAEEIDQKLPISATSVAD
ncbi:MAG: DUF3037 domain-containing protein [Planctomycetes bacterium]|nr:DUF3037 domain-containing protein [Planctomycetota bacterium]